MFSPLRSDKHLGTLAKCGGVPEKEKKNAPPHSFSVSGIREAKSSLLLPLQNGNMISRRSFVPPQNPGKGLRFLVPIIGSLHTLADLSFVLPSLWSVYLSACNMVPLRLVSKLFENSLDLRVGFCSFPFQLNCFHPFLLKKKVLFQFPPPLLLPSFSSSHTHLLSR